MADSNSTGCALSARWCWPQPWQRRWPRTLCPAPLLSTSALAVSLLATDSSHPDRAALLTRIAGNGLVAAVAWDDVDMACARDHGGQRTLTGSAARVCDGHDAQVLLVAAQADGDETLFSVELDQPGVSRRRLTGLDRARTHADVTLTEASATALGPVSGQLERALRTARITVAADLVGVSAQCLDLAVAYAQQRRQFGRVIGSYQAIKHRCARMFIETEQARSCVRDAAWRADHCPDGLDLAAEGALWFAAQTAITTSADLIRVLGGTGFTWEHEAHLYFRRARAQAVLLGDQMRRSARIADRLIAP